MLNIYELGSVALLIVSCLIARSLGKRKTKKRGAIWLFGILGVMFVFSSAIAALFVKGGAVRSCIAEDLIVRAITGLGLGVIIPLIVMVSTERTKIALK